MLLIIKTRLKKEELITLFQKIIVIKQKPNQNFTLLEKIILIVNNQ
jgi:hypothetical protein